MAPENTAVVRQRLGKYVTAATNTHSTIEGLFNVVFSIRPVSYQMLSACSQGTVGNPCYDLHSSRDLIFVFSVLFLF